MPLWYHKTDDYRWLTGSIRQDLQPDERSVWADFLALAGLTREPRRGYIERSEGIPYDKKYLLTFLNITEDLYDRSVAKCVKEGRLQVFPDGTMYLTNFKVYNPDAPPKGEAKATATETDGNKLKPAITETERRGLDIRAVKRAVVENPDEVKRVIADVEGKQAEIKERNDALDKLRDKAVKQ